MSIIAIGISFNFKCGSNQGISVLEKYYLLTSKDTDPLIWRLGPLAIPLVFFAKPEKPIEAN